MERTEALSLLELGNAATRDEIKARAIKLFNEYHPDKHAEATGNPTLKKLLEEKFNKVREARDCLLNGGVFDAGAFTPNAAKPPPPAPPQEDRIAKVLWENIKAAVDSGDWANVAWRAVELAKRPGHEQAARRFLARACIQLGRFDTAKEAALAATNFDSNDDEAWFLLALTLAKQEQWQEAKRAIRLAITHSHSTETQYEELRADIECARSPEPHVAKSQTAPSACPNCGALFGFKDGVCRGCGFPRPLHSTTQGQDDNRHPSTSPSSAGSPDLPHVLASGEGRFALAAFGIIGGAACAVVWGWVGFVVGGAVSVWLSAAGISLFTGPRRAGRPTLESTPPQERSTGHANSGRPSPDSFDFLHPVETVSGRLVVCALGVIGGGLSAAFWGWSGFIVGGIVSALLATAALAVLAAFVEATRRSAINPIAWVFTIFVAGLAFAGTWYIVHDLLAGGRYSSIDSYQDAALSARRTSTVIAGVVATVAGLIAYGTVRAVSGRGQTK